MIGRLRDWMLKCYGCGFFGGNASRSLYESPRMYTKENEPSDRSSQGSQRAREIVK